MSHCGSPGMCGRQADCSDTHCPGRPEPLSAADMGYECALPRELLGSEPSDLDDALDVSGAILGALTIAAILGLAGWFVVCVMPILSAVSIR